MNFVIGTTVTAQMCRSRHGMTDIETSMKTREQYQELSAPCRATFDAIPAAIVVSDVETKQIYWANRGARDAFGYTIEELTRFDVGALTHPDFRSELAANYAISSGESGLVTFKRYLRKDGTSFLAELRASRHPDNPHLVIAIIIDIDNSDRMRVDLARSAATDALTGLLRRDAFTSAALAKIKAGTPYGLIFLDLDNFKDVNDVYGHAAGDKVLKAVGTRMKNSFRQHDLLCRLGGDEFVVFVNRLDRSIVLRRIIHELLMNVETPVELPLASLIPLASVGGVLADPGCQLAYALDEADRAMYRAKHSEVETVNGCRAELVHLSMGSTPEVCRL